MLWFKKQVGNKTIQSEFDAIQPAEMQIELDADICRMKLQQLLDAAEEKGGIGEFIIALQNKQQMFSSVLNSDVIDQLDGTSIDALLDTVFTSRRKLPASLSHVPHEVLAAQIKDLLYGDEDIFIRMEQFVLMIDTENRKIKRAAWDFAAELLHFSRPEVYPHMSRWVWDENETSGALREFILGGDSMQQVPLGGRPEDFEASRVWFANQLGKQGFYRDIHYLIDLLVAQAYAEYLLSMSNGMGMFSSRFGADDMQPLDFVVKLLGIDPPRKNGLTRLKKVVVH